MNELTDKIADVEVTKTSSFPSPPFNSLQAKFSDLVAQDNLSQAELFLKSFVFALGDSWKEVMTLCDSFQLYLNEKAEKHDLDPVQAADFLQKQGRTRTAMQRRSELKDIDLDMNDRICFTEYLLLHFKVMILTEYFTRHKMEPTVSLENDGVGLVDVGNMLLEELFTLPIGLSQELLKAIEDFVAHKQARDDKIKELKEKMEMGGVKGLTAKNELIQLESQDMTEMNRVELTLAAAKRRGSKESGAEALLKKKEADEFAKKEAEKASRNKLKARAAMFEN